MYIKKQELSDGILNFKGNGMNDKAYFSDELMGYFQQARTRKTPQHRNFMC